MAKASDNPYPSLLLVEQAAAPATPAAGQARLYRGTDNKLYIVDDAGAATEVGGSGGTSTAGVIASKSYSPGTLASYTTASTTSADVDATNLAVTFIAPASGKVMVRLEGLGGSGGTATDNMTWTLREGTTDVASGMAASGGISGGNNSYARSFLITGLTPGSSHTYKWGWKSNTGTNTCRLYASGAVGAAIMEVHALP